MKKYITSVMIASFSFLCLVSCGGGDGNGEAFTVFDVLLNIEVVEGFDAECPDKADLKLSLLIDENNISGFAELIASGKIGEAEPVTGLVQNGGFTMDAFGLTVVTRPADPSNPLHPGSGITLTFQEFQGVFMNEDGNGVLDRMEGESSGDVFVHRGDMFVCSAEFTGEFSGEERSSEGCVSQAEAPTLKCPAKGFINLCDVYAHYTCGFCEPYDDGVICADTSFNASECQLIDCLSVRCPGIGLVNLEGLDNYANFSVSTETHIIGCSSSF